LLQLWPVVVFACFMIFNSAEDAVQAEIPPPSLRTDPA
jgi:hypothetical protein